MTGPTNTANTEFITLRDFLDTQPWLSPAHGADGNAASCVACTNTAPTSLSASDEYVPPLGRVSGLATFFINTVMPLPLAVGAPSEVELQTAFPAVLATLEGHVIRLFLKSQIPNSLPACDNITAVPTDNEKPLCFTIMLRQLHAEPNISIADSPATDAPVSLVLRAPFITLAVEFPADLASQVRTIRDAMINASHLSTTPPPVSTWELVLSNPESHEITGNGDRAGKDGCSKTADTQTPSLQSTFNTFISTAAGLVMPSPFPYLPTSSHSHAVMDHRELLRAAIRVERAIRAAQHHSDDWMRFAEEGPTTASSDEMPTSQHIAKRREETQRSRARVESISVNVACKQ